jgi:hypothetical protein
LEKISKKKRMAENSNKNSNHNCIPYIPFNEKIITDKLLKRLYGEIKKAVIDLEIPKILEDICEEQGKKEAGNPGIIISDEVQKKYKQLKDNCMNVADKIKGRVVITLPDGHVVIDTCKGDGNTYDNYVDDVISENHNSRICIFQTQYHPEGVSYERKFSSTTFQKEVYLAVRLGPFRNSLGTIRLSCSD